MRRWAWVSFMWPGPRRRGPGRQAGGPKASGEGEAQGLRPLLQGLPFVSLAFHPWSVIRFDPSARELDIIFDGLAERGVAVVTATDAWRKLSSKGGAS